MNKRKNMKLPNAEKAYIDIAKLTGYCLNSEHPRGKHKARLFSSKLGITAANADTLKGSLLQAARGNEVSISTKDVYAQRYIIEFIMSTVKGKANIRSSWIILKGEDFPRLTSCYILRKED